MKFLLCHHHFNVVNLVVTTVDTTQTIRSDFVRIKRPSELPVKLFTQWSVSVSREIVRIRQSVPIISGHIKRSLLYNTWTIDLDLFLYMKQYCVILLEYIQNTAS